MAKQGEVVAPYFAHQANAECSGAWESAVHRMAKQLLREHATLLAPRLQGFALAKLPDGRRLKCAGEIHQRLVALENVREEVGFTLDAGSVVVDVVGEVAARGVKVPLLIEVAVTHFVDESKRSLLKQLGYAALEIDLSGVPREVTKDELRRHVIEEPSNRQWIHNPRVAELQERLVKEGLRNFAARNEYYSQSRDLRGVEPGPRGTDVRRRYLRVAAALQISPDDPPGLLSDPIEGEEAFGAPAAWWQTWLFHFLRSRATERILVNTTEELVTHLRNEFRLPRRAPWQPLIHCVDLFHLRLEAIGAVSVISASRYRLEPDVLMQPVHELEKRYQLAKESNRD